LNNYVAFGGILISDYLTNLSEYSANEKNSVIQIKDENDKFLPKIQFEGDFTYCGTPNQPCLITSLTYNTPVLNEIVDELEFNDNNTIAIRHEDRSYHYLQGDLNKKLLYGFWSNSDKSKNALVQLDVSNYYINSSENSEFELGELILNNNNYTNDINYCSTTKQSEYCEFIDDFYNIKLKNKCFLYTTITINDLIYNPNNSHRLYVKSNNIKESSEYIYYRARVDSQYIPNNI
jgi:hypothetical protein